MSSLYIGFYKRFTHTYIHFKVPNTVANTFTVEYYDKNDAAFKATTDFRDETRGFTRNGFFFFFLPKDSNGNHLWDKTTVNSEERFWIKLTPSVSHSAGTEIRGIAPLFSNDNDLIAERNNIVSKHAASLGLDGTWVLKHEAARKEIIQTLRNGGMRKHSGVESRKLDTKSITRFKNLTEHDFWDIDEIRQAAKFLTLSKIYRFELSDEADDKWDELGKMAEEKFAEALDVFYLSYDVDDDGKDDSEETVFNQSIMISRT